MEEENYSIPIRAWLKVLGISQRELSRRSGISQRTVYNILSSGRASLSKHYTVIAHTLGMTTVQLLAGPECEIVRKNESGRRP